MIDIQFVDLVEVDDDTKELVRVWRNEAEIRRFMINKHIIEKSEHLKWIDSLREKKNIKYWVVIIDNKPIGVVNLQNIDYSKKQSEWGIYIGESELRGKGIGKKIIYEFLTMFFNEMGFETLITKVLRQNIIAYKTYLKFKFREVDIQHENTDEIILMEYKKQEWDEYKERLKHELFNSNRK